MNKYKILSIIIGIETIAAYILSVLGLPNENIVLRTIFTLVYFTPVLILLHLRGKDKEIKEKDRKICKFMFWFIIVATVVAFIMTLVERFGA